MGLGLWALREIARVNHPIRSPSAFRPLTIEREREKERGEKGERKNRFLAGYGSRDLPTVCTPFYSAFIPSPPSALTPFFSFFFYFFSSAIPVRFLFSRFVLFFAPYEFRVSLVCSLSKAPPYFCFVFLGLDLFIFRSVFRPSFFPISSNRRYAATIIILLENKGGGWWRFKILYPAHKNTRYTYFYFRVRPSLSNIFAPCVHKSCAFTPTGFTRQI